MTDVLSYCTIADQSLALPFSRQTHGYEGSCFDVVAPDKWVRIKTAKGFPWDIKLVDQQFVYDWITEQDWTSPRDYKKFILNHPTPLAVEPFSDGVAMFPRFIPDHFVDSTIDTPASQTGFRIFKNCIWDGQPHNVGDIRHRLIGPFDIDHGGDVGVQPTLVHEYYWGGHNGVYKVKEENQYALHYGWVQWSVANLDASGDYITQNISKHNKLVACHVPQVVFPCF